MRLFRICAVVCLLALVAGAQTTLTVEQLVSFIKSSIQLKHPDKQVANFVSHLKLSERLEDRVVEELQGLGAGPHTVAALHNLRDATAQLPAPPKKAPVAAPAPIPPPSPEEQQRVLEEVREYAENYSKRLPDFICTQVTRRFADPTGLEFWRKMDTLTARLSYFDRKEDYKLIMVNDTPTTRAYDSVGGATSTGEFGSMLRELFDIDTHAEFEWERWATLRGKRAYVFSYRVAQPRSKWHIDYEHRLDIVAGYRGLVYIDKETRQVLRITLIAQDIPPSFPVNEANTMLDYDYTSISEREYLLPLRSEMRMRSGKFLSRNETEFRMYRKFSAEASINYETPPPLSEDQTKEQPPK